MQKKILNIIKNHGQTKINNQKNVIINNFK